ncbi:Acyl-CoA dehydrogenase [Enhygromyxa salina]|uniref:Acyl-CoA dehydrogenase n=1 Tax=Enhygromyxa salina TaxID=215803 RepID=A0A0C1ZLQ9_9BACT|nr:acyl-CoA dehydrogenase family protein [Enhygromyxa salina]KIG11693.1 Acyl-CoA dehydrogenase [Enhygromyxa salina]
MAEPLADKIAAFVRDRVLGNETLLDSLPKAPPQLYTEFGERGFDNWWIPKRYGGRGLSLAASVPIVEALAYGDAGLALSLFIGVIGSTVIDLFGSEAHKQRFLGAMAGQGATAATLGSELIAGSELLNLATTARREGDEWVLDGDKSFSTNAGFADHWMVIAKDAETQEFRAFLVAKPTIAAGVEIQRRWPMIGVRGSATYQIRLRGCRIPLDAVLDGNGVRLLEIGLNPSRTLIAATGIGIARRIRDTCMDYAANKHIKGEPLSANAVFAAKLGQMQIDIHTMRSVCMTAAREFDALREGPDAASQLTARGSLESTVAAKVVCGQLGWRIAGVGSEMFGGLGYTEDSLIGKLVRDMRYVSVVEGGEDVLRDFVYYRHVLPDALRRGASD